MKTDLDGSFVIRDVPNAVQARLLCLRQAALSVPPALATRRSIGFVKTFAVLALYLP